MLAVVTGISSLLAGGKKQNKKKKTQKKQALDKAQVCEERECLKRLHHCSERCITA